MPKSAKKVNSHFIEFIFTSLAIVTLSLSMFLLTKHFDVAKPEVQVLGSQIDLVSEQKFWQDILTQQPTYRDGWLELAKIEEEMGNSEVAIRYLDRAKTIDPNFTFK